MKQENKNSSSNSDNKGCAIGVALFVIVNIVYFFLNSSKEEIAGNGAFFSLVAFLVLAFICIKVYNYYTRNIGNKFVRVVIPIVIFVALMLLYGFLKDNISVMLVIGSIGFVAFSIAIGIWIYNSYKD